MLALAFILQPFSDLQLVLSFFAPLPHHGHQEQVFAELADRFKLEDTVRDQILATGVATLSEFRYFAQDDAELLAAFYTPVEGQLTNKPLQKARLRQAWAAVCQAEKTREDCGSHLTVSLEEEEEVLPSNQLVSLSEAFWKRYHISMPPVKRSLDVVSVWDLRSVLNQRTAGSADFPALMQVTHLAPHPEVFSSQLYEPAQICHVDG